MAETAPLETTRGAQGVRSVTSKSQLDQLIKEGYIAVDFYADWCKPCQRLAPIIAQLAQEYSNVQFAKVNVSTLKEISDAYNIQSIPVVIFFKNGKQAAKLGGLRDKNEYKRTLDALYPKQ